VYKKPNLYSDFDNCLQPISCNMSSGPLQKLESNKTLDRFGRDPTIAEYGTRCEEVDLNKVKIINLTGAGG
jgi:hypothetical protein